jgi:hypothetical protein
LEDHEPRNNVRVIVFHKFDNICCLGTNSGEERGIREKGSAWLDERRRSKRRLREYGLPELGNFEPGREKAESVRAELSLSSHRFVCMCIYAPTLIHIP